MAKVINSNQSNLIGLEVAYSARKKDVEVGGLFGWKSSKFNMNKLTDMKILDDENMIAASTGGKLAGAGIGALAFGGAGAIVGAMIGGGNKKIKQKKVALKFNKDWIIVEFEDSILDRAIMTSILADCKVEQESPF